MHTGDRTCTQETGRAHRRQDVHTGDRTCTQETASRFIYRVVSVTMSVHEGSYFMCRVVGATLSVHEVSHFMCCQCHLVSP